MPSSGQEGRRADSSIAFDDLVLLLRHLGFQERIHGSHHIFSLQSVPEIVNIQPRPDHGAKTYQVRQVRAIINRYHLWRDSDAQV